MQQALSRASLLRGGHHRDHVPFVQKLWPLSMLRNGFPTRANHYRRCVVDLPLSGRVIRLVVIARRFRCAVSKNGMPVKQIVRQTGHSRTLVRQVIRRERNNVFRTRQSALDFASAMARRSVGIRLSKRSRTLAALVSARLPGLAAGRRRTGASSVINFYVRIFDNISSSVLMASLCSWKR
jgi:hypothetical protein